MSRNSVHTPNERGGLKISRIAIGSFEFAYHRSWLSDITPFVRAKIPIDLDLRALGVHTIRLAS